jgi:hypothetical protein
MTPIRSINVIWEKENHVFLYIVLQPHFFFPWQQSELKKKNKEKKMNKTTVNDNKKIHFCNFFIFLFEIH